MRTSPQPGVRQGSSSWQRSYTSISFTSGLAWKDSALRVWKLEVGTETRAGAELVSLPMKNVCRSSWRIDQTQFEEVLAIQLDLHFATKGEENLLSLARSQPLGQHAHLPLLLVGLMTCMLTNLPSSHHKERTEAVLPDVEGQMSKQ